MNRTVHAPFAGRDIRRVGGAVIRCVSKLGLAPTLRGPDQISRFDKQFCRRHLTVTSDNRSICAAQLFGEIVNALRVGISIDHQTGAPCWW